IKRWLLQKQTAEQGEFRTVLKQLRGAAGLTQRELAKTAKVGLATLRKWEEGIALPRPAGLAQLAHALNCQIRKLARHIRRENKRLPQWDFDGAWPSPNGRQAFNVHRASKESGISKGRLRSYMIGLPAELQKELEDAFPDKRVPSIKHLVPGTTKEW